MSAAPLQAFSAFGIELEYMLVDKTRLDVQPIADIVLAQLSEEEPSLVRCSNELVLHVLEMKNPEPGPLSALPVAFQAQVQHLNARLASLDACLMPTAMHPWMDPTLETALWPHDEQAIYSTYHTLFDCNRHSWANVQSMHVNLPFADDEQFEKLFAAVRILLPILPAIAASSPIADGKLTGYLDYRMHVYRDQSPSQPCIVGDIIPELVKTPAEYESQILAPIYQDIAPLDPQQNLRFEWLNARGAIARFDRNAIEIRVMDVQECPQADIALAALVVDAVHALYQEQFCSLASQQSLSAAKLSDLLTLCSRDGEAAYLDDSSYLAAWAYPGLNCLAKELWLHIGKILQAHDSPHAGLWKQHLQYVLKHGSLARRILRHTGENPDASSLHQTYKALTQKLETGTVLASVR